MAASKCAVVMVGTGSSSSSPSSMTSSPAASRARSFSISFSIDSRIANLAARWQISVKSAPVNLSVCSARYSRSTSGDTGDLRSTAFRMLEREGLSGIGMKISWSKRPGRMMAGSRMSGRLVAPMMKMLFFEPTPSISVSIWFMTRSPAPPASPREDPRAFAIESSSSKKSTHGAAPRALSNTSRTLPSDSPNHIVSSSGPLMEMKLAWHSLATAFANSVLPHPGGP
mmetsp:Transcript_176846/g.430218  ORF Transcript_176846/g.430218 Transcript_176846/m.430218 type:complete len:227 (-) Transcript_176846:1607-2287(-)